MAKDTRFLKKIYLFSLTISCVLGISICINVYLFHAFHLPLPTKKFEKVLISSETDSASYDPKLFHPFQDPKCRHFNVQVCNILAKENFWADKNKYLTGGQDEQQSAEMVLNVLPRKWRNLGPRTYRERNRILCYSNGRSSGLRVAWYVYTRNIASINSVFHLISGFPQVIKKKETK